MIGRKLNRRYKITSLLGEGAMGEVYQATDQQTGKLVAVKVLAPHLITQQDTVERFRREAETLQQLDHPNIVKFVDSFEYDGQFVIVMEYVTGGSLHDLLRRGRLPVEEARQITLDLCDALIRAHRLNIIHRDIKPENILISKDGTPKLADFGVARLTGSTRMTRSGTQVGTPYYMSPEAWEGQKLEAPADIWSLGVMLFEMLAGEVPFGGDTGAAVMTKVLTTDPPDIKQVRDEVPQDLEKIVTRMLTRDRSKRYQTMREVALDLERGQTEPLAKAAARRQVAAQTPTQNYSRKQVEAQVAASAPRPSRARTATASDGRSTRRAMFFALGLIGLVIVAAGGYWIFQNLSTMSQLFATIRTSVDAPTAPAGTAVATQITVGDPKGNRIAISFVPATEFSMGADASAGFAECQKTTRTDCKLGDYQDEAPPHKVSLDAFYIDSYEVTNGLYEACVNEGTCKAPESLSSENNPTYFGNPEFNDFPVIYVPWDQADAYCRWRGARLPTEAQWELAARGTDGRSYPWGNEADPSNANFNNPAGDTQRVGSFAAGMSPFGVYDMAGNVWEWIADFYSDTYYQNSPLLNPLGPDSGTPHVLRGGSYYDTADLVRTTVRLKQTDEVNNNFGFRCVRNVGQ